MNLLIEEKNGSIQLKNVANEEWIATIFSEENIQFNKDVIITKQIIMQIANILLDLKGYIERYSNQQPTLFSLI